MEQPNPAEDAEIPAANGGIDASRDGGSSHAGYQRTQYEDLAAAPAAEPEGDSAAGLWALFLGLGLLMIGNGLNGAVIGVRSGSEGFSVVVTGVIMAGYFAGFLIAPSLVVKMIASVGHIRVFAGLASLASSAVLIHALSVLPVTWTAMRFVFGFCFAGLYIVIESWLAELSTPANRGRTLAVYMIVSMAGLGIGQYLIAVADPNGFRLFIVSSVLVSLALVPVTLAAAAKVPPSRPIEKVSIRELIGYVPTGVVGSFMSGASAGVLLGLAALYGVPDRPDDRRHCPPVAGWSPVRPGVAAQRDLWRRDRSSSLVRDCFDSSARQRAHAAHHVRYRWHDVPAVLTRGLVHARLDTGRKDGRCSGHVGAD